MNFNHPFYGKNKFATYAAFGLLGGLMAYCYFKAIDIGKAEVLDYIYKNIQNEDIMISSRLSDGSKMRVRCTLDSGSYPLK